MRVRHITLAALVLTAVSSARADDWPQWMGPKRDNIWRETGIIETFPAGGPKRVWSTPLAGGYAGPAVAGGKVFVTDYVTKDKTEEGNFDRKETTGTERVFCLDEANGKVVWKHVYPVKYAISYPAGPRCTPTVHEGKVYTLGAEGDLICFEAATGKIVWQKNLKKEYQTETALWGYAAHPLIDGKKLLTLAGRDGNHVVALDKDTGKEIWKSRSQKEQGYSPVFITEAGGKRQLIAAGPSALRSLDPETGTEYWATEYTADNGAIIMTPVRSGDHLFVGGYSNKNLLVKLATDKPGVEVVAKDKRNAFLSPVNVQPFLEGNILYGYHEDGNMFAVELPSGKRLWDSPGPVGKVQASGTAFIVKNGDRFVFFAETGDLVFGKLSKEGYDETARAKVIEPTQTNWGRQVVWCAPAFANKKMFVRSDAEIICVDLAK